MWTRWIIRLVVIVSVLVIGAMADAQNRNAGGGSSAGGAGGGGNRGGGSAAAPSQGSPPSNSGGGGSSGSGSGGSISGTGSAIGSTGSSIGSTGTPIRGTGTNVGTGQQGGQGQGANPPQPPVRRPPVVGNPPRPPVTGIGTDPGRQRRDRHRDWDRNRPPRYPGATYILPPQYGWAPYTWWFNGNSYWLPSGWDDGYYGDNDRDGTYDDPGYDRVADAPQPPTVPATPSPAQEQARSANAVEGTPAYGQAMAEFKAAQQAYEDASERVLAKLRKDPEYQRLVARRDRAAEEVEARQASAKVPPNESDRVWSAAQEKLNASSKVTKLEQDAIAADPQASAAKARMVEANERLAALRKGAEAGAPK